MNKDDDDDTQGYLAAQPKREWVGLTDEERDAMAGMRSDKWRFLFRRYAKAVERVLKEKNHG